MRGERFRLATARLAYRSHRDQEWRPLVARMLAAYVGCCLFLPQSVFELGEIPDLSETVKLFAFDGKTGRGVNALGCGRSEYDNTCFRGLSRSIGAYRPPAVRFNGMSDGIDAVRCAERQTEQAVEWLGDD
jgi:hypothetical protein